jgi:hypothetical protein
VGGRLGWGAAAPAGICRPVAEVCHGARATARRRSSCW